MMMDRRNFVSHLAVGALSTAAFAQDSRKLTVRDVVEMIVSAKGNHHLNLAHRDLSGLNLADLDLHGADLSYCNLFGADLSAANLQGANLSYATLDRATLIKADFSNAILENASIRRPNVFSDMNLHPGDLPLFRYAILARSRVTARLDGADFTGANLANANFVVWEERNLGGPPVGGLQRCNFTSARMTDINVRGLSLSRSVLRDADLSGADLRDADLSHVDFEGATLTRARFDGAKLEDATGLERLR
jgi:uncharacterized protein YjbI with pentapeptide repeats